MSQRKRTAQELLKDELDIDLEEDEKWEDQYRDEYRDILDYYSEEEKQVLNKKHYGENLFGEVVEAPINDDFDEEKFQSFVNAIIKRDTGVTVDTQLAPKNKKKRKKRKKREEWWEGVYLAPRVKKSSRIIKIKKKAFQKLRKIADEQDLYYGFECAGFLYGKNDVITKVKKYECFASAGLVSGNPLDVFKQMQKKNYIGLFHSHLFSSSSPSGTDTNVLCGWTSYANMVGKKEPIMIIARAPRWKISGWSMNAKFELFENTIIII